MGRHRAWALGLCLCAALPARAEGPPARERLLVGLDGKTFFRPGGVENGPNGADAVAVIDVTDPARPQLAHVIEGLDNSVYGPPTNLAITPDGRLGLVASAVLMGRAGPGEPWYARADDRLHVLDLTAEPPRLSQTIRVGRQPSGLAVARSGDLALVANREGRSVTVLGIDGASVTALAEVDVGGEAAAVAISPDGTRALVAKVEGRVGALAIRGRGVTYDPALDVPVGPGAYGLAFTPDGLHALVCGTGAEPSDGAPDALTLIDVSGPRPRVAEAAPVGDTLEALAVAPDGRHAAVAVVGGAAAPRASPAHTPGGAVALVAIAGGRLGARAEAPAGTVLQGVAFDRSGRYVYVGAYADRTLAVYAVAGDAVADTGVRLPLPGQPASLGGRP